MTIPEIILTVAIIFATVMITTTAVALWRAPNALTRANLMGPTVCVGVPVLIMAKLLRDATTHGLTISDIIRAVVAITGLLVVASVSSFYMGRSVHGLEGDEILIDPPTKQMRQEESDAEAKAQAEAEEEKKAQAKAEKCARTARERKRAARRSNRDHNPFAPEHHPKVD